MDDGEHQERCPDPFHGIGSHSLAAEGDQEDGNAAGLFLEKSATPIRGVISDAMLPLLAGMASGSILSVARLYETFSRQHGRFSKRQFEMRLNQICHRPKPEGKSTSHAWALRPEYRHILEPQETAVDRGEPVADSKQAATPDGSIQP